MKLKVGHPRVRPDLRCVGLTDKHWEKLQVLSLMDGRSKSNWLRYIIDQIYEEKVLKGKVGA